MVLTEKLQDISKHINTLNLVNDTGVNLRLRKKITVLSFFYAYLVVMIHAYNIDVYEAWHDAPLLYLFEQFVAFGIAEIAVPSFFILSGFLFFTGLMPTMHGFINKYRKRFKSVVVPYLVWNLIAYIYWALIPRLPVIGYVFNNNPAKLNVGEFVNAVIFYKYNAFFWFIGYLIICISVSPILYYVLKRRFLGEIVLFILLVAWYLYGAFAHNDIHLSIFFFSVGSYIAVRMPKMLEIKPNKFISLSMLVLLSISILLEFTQDAHDLLDVPNTLLGVVTFWFLYDLLETRIKIYSWMKYTFFIYAVHRYVLYMLTKIVYLVSGKNFIIAFLTYLIAPIITIIILTYLARFLKTYLRLFWDISTGGRI